jgi:excisionase family DNA binding protein
MSTTMALAEAGHLPAVLSVGTAAEILGIGRSKAYEAVATGTWPTRVIRIGRCIRIPTADVLALVGLGTAS